MRIVLVGLVSLLVVAGCMPNVKLQNGYESKTATAVPATYVGDAQTTSCEVLVRSVADGRRDKPTVLNTNAEEGASVSGQTAVGAATNITNTVGVSVAHPDIIGWVRSALISTSDARISVRAVENGDVVANHWVLDVELKKAYLNYEATSKSANLVISTRLFSPKGEENDKTFRGRDTGVNWLNSDSEIQTAFDSAMEQILIQVKPMLLEACNPNLVIQTFGQNLIVR